MLKREAIRGFNIKKISLNKIRPYCISLMVLVMGYFLLLKQEIDQYTQLRSSDKMLREQFKMKQQNSVNMMEYKNELQTISAYAQSMINSLTPKQQIPELLNTIYKTGLDSGVSFELFSPLPEVTREYYIELPIAITVIGRYQSLMAFLSHVAHLNQLVTWHDFIIKHSSNKDEHELLMLTITAKLYRTQD